MIHIFWLICHLLGKETSDKLECWCHFGNGKNFLFPGRDFWICGVVGFNEKNCLLNLMDGRQVSNRDFITAQILILLESLLKSVIGNRDLVFVLLELIVWDSKPDASIVIASNSLSYVAVMTVQVLIDLCSLLQVFWIPACKSTGVADISQYSVTLSKDEIFLAFLSLFESWNISSWVDSKILWLLMSLFGHVNE